MWAEGFSWRGSAVTPPSPWARALGAVLLSPPCLSAQSIAAAWHGVWGAPRPPTRPHTMRHSVSITQRQHPRECTAGGRSGVSPWGPIRSAHISHNFTLNFSPCATGTVSCLVTREQAVRARGWGRVRILAADANGSGELSFLLNSPPLACSVYFLV